MAEVRERWEIGGGRGDPDAILQRIREEEEATEEERFEGRGRLVFFGYAAGMGKTFTMLAFQVARRVYRVRMRASMW